MQILWDEHHDLSIIEDELKVSSGTIKKALGIKEKLRRGKKNNKSIFQTEFSESQMAEMNNMYSTGVPILSIAKHFNCTRDIIYNRLHLLDRDGKVIKRPNKIKRGRKNKS